MIFQGVTNTPKTEAVTISIIYDIVKQKDLTQEYYLIEFKNGGKIVNLMTPESFLKKYKERKIILWLMKD